MRLLNQVFLERLNIIWVFGSCAAGQLSWTFSHITLCLLLLLLLPVSSSCPACPTVTMPCWSFSSACHSSSRLTMTRKSWSPALWRWPVSSCCHLSTRIVAFCFVSRIRNSVSLCLPEPCREKSSDGAAARSEETRDAVQGEIFFHSLYDAPHCT